MFISNNNFTEREVNITWDPLYQILLEDTTEYRYSLYLKLHQLYPESVLQKFLVEISNHLRTFSAGSEKFHAHWTSFCPQHMDSMNINWASTWSQNNETIASSRALCVRKDNGAVRLTGQCYSNFTHGAQLVQKQVTDRLDNNNTDDMIF